MRLDIRLTRPTLRRLHDASRGNAFFALELAQALRDTDGGVLSGTLPVPAPDLSRDPFHVWLSRWHWTTNVVVGLALLTLGGIPYVLWGIFFRTTWGLHSTWLVNSATHLWGARRFTTRDDSTNNWWVALLTFGEGWHNNHHAHPTSARHGLAWYELDLNWIGISALRALGLAWDIKVARIASAPAQEIDEAVA